MVRFDFSGLTYGELVILAHPMIDINNKIVLLNKYADIDLFLLTLYDVKKVLEGDEIKNALDEYIEFGDKEIEVPDVFKECLGDNDE